MAITRKIGFTIILVLAFSSIQIQFEVEGHRGLATPTNNGNTSFDVTQFGAKGNGKPHNDANGESLNGLAIMKAWQEACHCSQGPSKVVIPEGIYMVAQVIFAGPCKNEVSVELQGTMVADKDVSQFPNHEFVVFQDVDAATFTGPGTIDVSNQASKYNNLDQNKDVDFFNLMASIKVLKSKNVLVERITSVNPSAYHVLIVESQNVKIQNMKLNENSIKNKKSNTNNGIYIGASNNISVSSGIINTGGDCVTVAPGSLDISITGLICQFGQGISIGSKAYLDTSLDVKGVIVEGCSFKETAFGVRIIPRLEAKASLISDIKFEGLKMELVQVPIVISQLQPLLNPLETIQAKIVGVQFKNIQGTTTRKNPLSFSCSSESPCEGIEVDNVDLSFIEKLPLNANHGATLNSLIGPTLIPGGALNLLVKCLNANVLFRGENNGLGCNLLQ